MLWFFTFRVFQRYLTQTLQMMSAMSPRCTANRQRWDPIESSELFFPFVRNMIWASCNLLHEISWNAALLYCAAVTFARGPEQHLFTSIYRQMTLGPFKCVCVCVFDSEFLRHWCSWYFTHLKANKCHHHYGEHFVAHRHHQNGILWQQTACRGAISLNPF